MSLFSRLRSKLSNKRAPQARNSRVLRMSKDSTRRELIRVALRDTLARHGVPTAWIASEALTVTRAKGAQEPLMHVRFLIKHFEPQLLSQGLILQRNFLKRVSAFDPKAAHWLNGVSWQFALLEDGASHGMANVPVPAAPAAFQPPRMAAPSTSPRAAVSEPQSAPPEPTEEEKMEELRLLFSTTDVDRLTKKGSAGVGDFQETRPFNP